MERDLGVYLSLNRLMAVEVNLTGLPNSRRGGGGDASDGPEGSFASDPGLSVELLPLSCPRPTF
eukprot:scaffold287_cov337-Pavlova_lutheri.AAC.50